MKYPGKGDGIHGDSSDRCNMIDCNMSLPETSSSPMKTDGWKDKAFLWGPGLF